MMFSGIIKEIFECCNISNAANYLNLDSDYNLDDLLNNIEYDKIIRDNGISSFHSFKPNNSIRYLTNNLHQRFGTDQLSLLPKYDVSKLFDKSNSEDNIIRSGCSYLKTSFYMNDELNRFMELLYKGVMVKQVIDLSINDTRYIALYLSNNNKSLILDNFSGILLEVPLRSIIDVIYNEITDEKKSMITNLSIRKGYEPVKLNNDVMYTVLIDVGNQLKSICLTFNSKIDSLSFCTNFKDLINYFNYKNLER